MNRCCIMLVFGLVAGCARFQPQPLTPAKSAAELEGRTLDQPALRGFIETNRKHPLPEWPLTRWNLDDLTLAAFYYHPDLEVARARWAVTRAGEISAGERPNPSIGVAPAYNSTTAIPSPWIVTLTADVPIETAGKRGFRVAQAAYVSEAARLNIASMAWQVRRRVRNRLLDLRAAGELESLLRQQESIQEENLRLTELQHEAGAVSAFELTRARLATDHSRLALRDAEWQSTKAREQLAEAIGVPAVALNGARFSFESLTDPTGEVPEAGARRQALLNRADLLAALAEYAASQSALRLEIARQYPDVHLGPGYEYDQGDNKWSIGLSVTLPAFNQNQGAIAEAEARRAEAAARFVALQTRVLGEIDLAVAGFQAARRKKADADRMLGDVTRQEKVAEAMLQAGEISQSELTGLQLQLADSKLAGHDALVKVRQAAAQLEDALQIPLGLPAAAWQTSPQLTGSEEAKISP